jgi:tetratricopeptide (TPR) repeat protein
MKLGTIGWAIAAVLMAPGPSLAASAAEPAASGEEAVVTTTDAARLLGENKPAEAIELLDRIIAFHVSKNESDNRRKYCASSSEESLAYMVMAANDKQSATMVDRQLCMAIFLKGFALIDLKRPLEAKPLFDQALAMAPMNSQFLAELAEWHKVRREWEPSFALFERALDAVAFSPADLQLRRQCRALRGMGFIRIEQGNLDEARTLFERCLKIDPNDEKSKAELRFIEDERHRSSARAS